MPRRPPVALLAAVLCAALLAGCTSSSRVSPVALTPVSGLSAQAEQACARVVGALPQDLASGVTRRDVMPTSRLTAAWGDPAVTLRCGAPAANPRDEPFEFDSVRWFMHDTGNTRTWTTSGQPVVLEVVIPDRYDTQAEMLGSLAEALSAAR